MRGCVLAFAVLGVSELKAPGRLFNLHKVRGVMFENNSRFFWRPLRVIVAPRRVIAMQCHGGCLRGAGLSVMWSFERRASLDQRRGSPEASTWISEYSQNVGEHALILRSPLGVAEEVVLANVVQEMLCLMARLRLLWYSKLENSEGADLRAHLQGQSLCAVPP